MSILSFLYCTSWTTEHRSHIIVTAMSRYSIDSAVNSLNITTVAYLGLAGSCWILLGLAGSCWVLLGLAGSCWVLYHESG